MGQCGGCSYNRGNAPLTLTAPYAVGTRFTEWELQFSAEVAMMSISSDFSG